MRRLNTICTMTMLALCGAAACQQNGVVTDRILSQGWEFRMVDGENAAFPAKPEFAVWRKATVPGTVPTDLLALKLIPDPFYRDNEKTLQWIGLSNWEYRTKFTLTTGEMRQRHIEIAFDGLDTFADVYVNGADAGVHTDNMFRSWTLDAKPYLHDGENELRVLFHSAVEKMLPIVKAMPVKMPTVGQIVPVSEEGVPTDPYVRKAPYSYGWDWGPRFVNEGIWRPVHLRLWSGVRIDRVLIEQSSVNAASASLLATVNVFADRAGDAEITIAGGVIGGGPRPLLASRSVSLAAGLNHVAVPLTIKRPQLWWPLGYGAQPLYGLTVTAAVGGVTKDTKSIRTGLRSVELLRKKDDIGSQFTFVVNGVPVFAKGADVIPLDSFSSRDTPERQRHLLEAARDAHMNMVREWGGGYYQSDSFYDIADELGILVWQEFMFGGEQVPSGSSFRENVRAEAEDQVGRLRNHPSIVLWCGNNEVETGWYHWDTRLAFRAALTKDQQQQVWQDYLLVMNDVLKNVVTALAPEIPYTPSSPHAGYDRPPDVQTDGDMHYWEVWGGGVPVAAYNGITPRFMSEFGFQSFPSMETLKSFAEPEDLRLDSPVMLAHQKNDGGNAKIKQYMEAEYPPPRDFAAFVYVSQVQQAVAIRTAAEQLRASRPRTMGALYWQLNDVWPGPSWSSIDSLGRPKALQFYAQRFYADIMVAAEQTQDSVQVSLINDTQKPVTASMEIRVMDFHGGVIHRDVRPVTIPAAGVLRPDPVSVDSLLHGRRRNEVFASLVLRDASGAELSTRTVYFAPVKELKMPRAKIVAEWSRSAKGEWLLTLTSDALARDVVPEFEGVEAGVEDSFFDLLPHVPHTFIVRSSANDSDLKRSLHIMQLADAFAAFDTR